MPFQNTVHIFEDLDKEDMVNRKKGGKNRRKRNARTPWKRIHKKISEVALTAYVDPRNTSRECPRCGLKMNRHKAASINIRRRHLEEKRREKRRASMRGFPHSNEPEISMKVELWAGVAQGGGCKMRRSNESFA
jgi:putative transposase